RGISEPRSIIQPLRMIADPRGPVTSHSISYFVASTERSFTLASLFAAASLNAASSKYARLMPASTVQRVQTISDQLALNIELSTVAVRQLHCIHPALLRLGVFITPPT